MTNTTKTGTNLLLNVDHFADTLFAIPANAGQELAPPDPDPTEVLDEDDEASAPAVARRPRQRGRKFDPDSVLTYGDGLRVPSRMGGTEWARDAVDWPRGTTACATAMAVALRLDETLVCWPKQKTLAKDICSTDKSVRTALRDLEEHHVVGTLYLYRGKDLSGCVYVLNIDGWLDDVLDDRPAFLKRVAHVRAEGFRLGLNINRFPEGTTLSIKKPTNEKGPSKG